MRLKFRSAFSAKNMVIWLIDLLFSICVSFRIAVALTQLAKPRNSPECQELRDYHRALLRLDPHLKRVALFTRELHHVSHHVSVSLTDPVVGSLRLWTRLQADGWARQGTKKISRITFSDLACLSFPSSLKAALLFFSPTCVFQMKAGCWDADVGAKA